VRVYGVSENRCLPLAGPSEHSPPEVVIIRRVMPRPEDVSRDHIDATVMSFLKGEKDADWTEVSHIAAAFGK